MDSPTPVAPEQPGHESLLDSPEGGVGGSEHGQLSVRPPHLVSLAGLGQDLAEGPELRVIVDDVGDRAGGGQHHLADTKGIVSPLKDRA